MSIKNAVIITDCSDIAFVEMHQTLLNHVKGDIKIAPCVSVQPFSVLHAAFNIRLLAEIYPPEKTIFIVVVSGIQSNPERIFGKTKHGLMFVGNNSGYFDWLIRDFGFGELYENKTNREVHGQSFGGKYVQIPTAAKLIAEINSEEIGIKRPESFLKSIDISDGTVVHIDNFGLIKIKAPLLIGYTEGEKLKICINGKSVTDAIYTEKMKRQPDGSWVLFPGSSIGGLPELGKVRSPHSANELSVKIGDVVTWKRQ